VKSVSRLYALSRADEAIVKFEIALDAEVADFQLGDTQDLPG
jgi:hypothetical protein